MQALDHGYAVHSFSSHQGVLTLPDSTMALCIGLVVGYMIYIIFSLMFKVFNNCMNRYIFVNCLS